MQPATLSAAQGPFILLLTQYNAGIWRSLPGPETDTPPASGGAIDEPFLSSTTLRTYGNFQ
ncbi:hypothetical protein FY528_00725 [Hymenobacter lutimineralis]|uniref:Uncharacterized protein n=1 Tax=Hymenobacter lutimineralis TaxID=2606448 RepID=A0A5D6VFL8_9BACT|nr:MULTISPECIES: hypothetical protein [Hymenobacter]QIX60295.1 hypothetical protein HER32_03455 [Hymenobacter sp. BT18]TYZ14286.1 hypothetical protein FY528_00725 [Hymenobacter lutimineralis]